MKKNILYILLLSSITSCKYFAEPRELWFYTYASGNPTKSALTPANFLYLKKDGSYTRDFGIFDYGHWKKEDKELKLTSFDKKQTILIINRFDNKNLNLQLLGVLKLNLKGSLLPVPKIIILIHFKIIPGEYQQQNETEQQIKKRLKNHCRFWEEYFRWALDNNVEYIDVRSTPTPIKIYGNGFGLKNFEDLPLRWRSYFYDSSDCRKANDILQHIFLHEDIAWANTDNRYKMLIAAFQQLQQFL